jgi:hypothetical protein
MPAKDPTVLGPSIRQPAQMESRPAGVDSPDPNAGTVGPERPLDVSGAQLLATTYLFRNPMIPADGMGGSVSTGDFNEDGIPDLAMAGSVLLGYGDGTFGPASILTPGAHFSSVAVGDFNRDRHQDLVLTDTSASTIAVFLGDGRGSFSRTATLPCGGDPRQISVADFNGDGVDDLVDLESPSLTVRLGRGDGTFQGPGMTSGVDAEAVVIADLDHDGHQDIAMVSKTGPGPQSYVALMLGRGDGSFLVSDEATYPAQIMSLTAGHFHDDASFDLAVVAGYPAELLILHLRDNGTIGSQSTIGLTDLGLPGFSVQVVNGDVDGDGHADLVVTSLLNTTSDSSSEASEVIVFHGRGDGSFILAQTELGPPIAGAITIQNLDGDGRPDLIVGGPRYVMASLQLPDGTFGYPKRNLPPNSESVDLNGDGQPDFVRQDPQSGMLIVLMNKGDGQYLEKDEDIGDARLLEFADVNADLYPDLLATSASEAGLIMFLGRGDGSFQEAGRYAEGVKIYGPQISDVNNDGTVDVVVGQGATGIMVLLGTGGGVFSAPITTATSVPAVVLRLGDFDGDGVVDVAVGDGHVFLTQARGLGDGRFVGGFPTWRESEYSYAMGLGDLNEDGLPDVVVVDPIIGRTLIYKGTRGAGLTPGGVVGISSGNGLFGPTMADFNGDGHLDVMLVDQYTTYVTLGNGDGTFTGRGVFFTGPHAKPAGLGDYNDDGLSDMLFATENAPGEVYVLLNQGPYPDRSPVAKASSPPQAECASPVGTSVLFDGSASSDPDSRPGTNDDIVSYNWFEVNAEGATTSLGSGPKLDAQLLLGNHVIGLEVKDRRGRSNIDLFTTAVVDTQPPALLCPPASQAECSGPSGRSLSLVASATDRCSPSVQVWNDRTSGGADASGIYPLGMTTTTFSATDASGNVAACTTPVTVQDTIPPALSVVANPPVLWPPNHALVPVDLSWQAHDICDANPSVTLVSITSSEPTSAAATVAGGGIGSDIADAQIGSPDSEVLLRADRLGTGPGRTYELTYIATDASGNATPARVVVTVPHDQSEGPGRH